MIQLLQWSYRVTFRFIIVPVNCTAVKTTAVQHVSFVNVSPRDKTNSTCGAGAYKHNMPRRRMLNPVLHMPLLFEQRACTDFGATVSKRKRFLDQTPDFIRSHMLCYPSRWPQASYLSTVNYTHLQAQAFRVLSSSTKISAPQNSR